MHGRSTLRKSAADPDLKVLTPAGVERVDRPELGVLGQRGHARQITRARQPARSPLSPPARDPRCFRLLPCLSISHADCFGGSQSQELGGAHELLARRMAAGVEWMTADARADACGHAADERERTSGTALEHRPAVVGHRWPTAAGPDELVPAWQVVVAGLRAWHGRCTAWRRARGRRALRWSCRRRRRRANDARLRRLALCSKCAVCMSVRAKTRFAPDFRASQGVYV